MEFERKRYHAHLDIAPLVDVVLLLLLFFMLTSHLIQEPAIKVRLPESKTAEIRREETVSTLFITRQGEIFLMDRRMDLGTLQAAIREHFKDPGKESLRLKVDREVPVGLLVSVIDEVRLAGIENFRIQAERK